MHCATVRFTSERSYKWIKWWKALFIYACDVGIDRWEVKLLTTYLPFNYSWQNVKIHRRSYLDLTASVNTVRPDWDWSISCGQSCGWNALGIWTGDPGLITLCHTHCNIQHLWGYDLWAGNHTGHSCFFKSIRGVWRFHNVSLEASQEAKHQLILYIILDPHSWYVQGSIISIIFKQN